LIICSCYWIV